MNDEIIPSSYAAWHHCITVKCGIALTPDYVAKRIQALHNERDPHTSQLRKLYGEDHHQNLLRWFAQARQETSPA